MTVIDLRSFKVTSPPKKSVLCLGNFDGVHIGHRELVRRTLEEKERLYPKHKDIKSGAWFFSRAPLEIITGKKLPRITELEQKLEIFAALGLDLAFVYDYEEVGDLSPEKFVHDILQEECGCVFAVCGYNFKFGHNAVGDAALLSRLMEGNAAVIDEVTLGSRKVSSSEIRKLISDGDIQDANALLGRNYSINGAVLHGKQLGRKLGIPTINQQFDFELVILKKGIYISRALIDGKWHPSVSNIGFRPSFEDSANINCETYIIDFDGNLYGQNVKVEFLKRLRDEKKFESVEALKTQIKKDIEQTKTFFSKK